MKKILIMALVFSLALVSFTGATQGTIDELQGYWVESYDGQALFTDGDAYYANITAVAMPSGQIAINDPPIGGGYVPEPGAGTFGWDVNEGSRQWQPDDAPIGDNVYWVSEHEDGYIWAAWRLSEGNIVTNPREELWAQYEPIAVPEATAVGTDYIELSINAPKYTCRWGDTTVGNGGTYNQGTFELLESYAVFIEGGNYTEWTHIGNAVDFTAGPDNPIVPYDEDVDPGTVDTGHYTLNVTGLEAGTAYNFTVRMNLNFEGFNGGYGGGLGSYTTWGTGAASGPITTEEDVPEFGPGMLVPVVAIVGMFVAFTVYRRKKED